MKGFIIAFALCVLGTYALPQRTKSHFPLRGRISGGTVAENAPHACMVLVTRPSGTPGTAALGSGAIISQRHVLSANHLTQGQGNTFQIGFIVGTARRLVRSSFALAGENYNGTSFHNDISLIFVDGTLPIGSIVQIALDATLPAAAAEATVVGFGFTSATSNGASTDPYAAAQTVAVACTTDQFTAAESHFCAIDSTAATIVCPGDNGAGLFTSDVTDPDNPVNTLVGIASRIIAGCTTAAETGYTRVGLHATWIRNIAGINADTFMAMHKKNL